METKDLLADAFGRINETVHRAVEGLSEDTVLHRLDPDANSIAWLVWHLVRIQDDHVANLSGREQSWTEDGWNTRFGTSVDASNLGYGHTSEQVAGVIPDEVGSLLGYHDAVYAQTLRYLETVDADELDRIIDPSWDPPVTVGVRLVSVINDNTQHAGQARFIRGILERTGLA